MERERILVVDDDRTQCLLLQKLLEEEGYRVTAAESGHAAVQAFHNDAFDLVLSDLRMPDLDGIALYTNLKTSQPDLLFVLITAFGTISNAVQAVRAGIYDYITKPVNAEELFSTLSRAFEVQRLKDENALLREEVQQHRQSVQIVGSSKQMTTLMETIHTVARSNAAVLLRGESGTGKELVATAIHTNSQRSDKPLIKVNCGALPETLLEDELFGHERGAFTGAEYQRKGRFELADGGTIFLDEIAEMPPHLQVKLLRVLQEKQFERIGSSSTITVDTRVIACTSQDLEQLVSQNRFRQDLYYRINVVPITLPALRERRDDILLLANYFIRKYCEQDGRSLLPLSEEARGYLVRYSWPGNVRELENCIERAVVLERGKEIQASTLTLEHDMRRALRGSIADELLDDDFSMDDFEREMLARALARTGWNQSRAAELLGLTRRTLQYRMEKYGITQTNAQQSS